MINESKPSYEFDAYLKADSQTPILCNVTLWLPKDADENARMEIDSPEEVDIIENFMGKYVSIESEIYEENPRFVAIISKARIQQVQGQAERRKLSRTRIKLLHAWDLSISENRECAGDGLTTTIYFQISNLIYA